MSTREHRLRAQAAPSVPRRSVTPLAVSLSLLAISLLAAVALIILGVPVSPPGAAPWICLVTGVLVTVRVIWSEKDHDQCARLVAFFINLGLTATAVWLSPVFGLYAFMGFYEAGLFKDLRVRVLAVVGTTLVVAVAQVGGTRSEIFTLPIYLAFAGVTLLIALSMVTLDAQRERLMEQVETANAELREERARSAELTDQLVAQAREAGVAEERKRLSREIHDTVAQDLVAIIAQLDALSDEPDEAHRMRRLSRIDSTARDALGEARRAVAALASPRLDDSDLPLAIDDLLGQWREVTGLGGELTVEGSPVASPHDEHLLRVVQETLANVAKHARARRADVALAYSPTRVAVTVRDDGRGFDPDAVSAGFGLVGLRARLERVGGGVAIDGGLGHGATVSASIPLEHRSAP